MRLHNLNPGKAATRKKRKRVGRGPGSGLGKTSGRGQDGQLSRSGGGKGSRFEGGQTPLQRRLPKLPGFKNRFRKVYAIVNVEKLNIYKSSEEVSPESLQAKGIIKRSDKLVKVLGQGNIEKKLLVKAHHFSGTAKEKIEAAGGKIEVL
ncbi:MAG TPA: 50S ribosomal protein L15 [Actinobacteria bacterium]|nr:50S ribosomal protein L15 [Actinomycetes bacterium]HEX21181.1 50S ribosomal protein L15 [Actinomycetota bacterium]